MQKLTSLLRPFIFPILFLIIFIAFSATSFGASFIPEDSTTTTIQVNLQNDANVSALHFDINPFPTSIVLNDPNKEVSFNPVNNELIIFGMAKDTAIASGNILTLTFDDISVNTDILIDVHDAADKTMPKPFAVTVDGGVGSITLTFSEADIRATAFKVIDVVASVGNPIDIDADGDYDALDVQELVNRQ